MKNSLIAIISTVALLGCKDDQIGPDLAAATDNFKVIESLKFDKSKPDFKGGDIVSFSAKFNEKITWSLNVTGLQSGAVMAFSETSNEIKLADAKWNGSSSNINFFHTGEPVVAVLDVVGSDEYFSSDTMSVSTEKRYDAETINKVKHFLVDDFDKTKLPTELAAGRSTDGNDSELDFDPSSVTKVQGDYSYRMSGNDDNNNGWCGGINNEKLLELVNYVPDYEKVIIDSGVSPDDLFVNIWIYGTESKGTTVEFKIYEVDADSVKTIKDVYDFSKSGVYNQSKFDGWIYDLPINWEGWKEVNIPYSAFRAANALNAGGNGDRVKESFRITGVGLSLLSYPTAGLYVDTYVDNFYITMGGKFQR